MSGAGGTRGKVGGRGPVTRSQRSAAATRPAMATRRVASRADRSARDDSSDDSPSQDVRSARTQNQDDHVDTDLGIASARVSENSSPVLEGKTDAATLPPQTEVEPSHTMVSQGGVSEAARSQPSEQGRDAGE